MCFEVRGANRSLRVLRGREKIYEGQVERGSAVAFLSEDSLAVFSANALDVVRLAH